MNVKNIKPLGHRAYGSIPHLSDSRLGPSDKKANPGHEKILTSVRRDCFDIIVVQEKLDGSNCSVAKINGKIFALTRAGYEARTSPYIQHLIFDKWVKANANRFNELLNDGERATGEWLYQSCGTLYHMDHEPFVLFDIMKIHERLPYWELIYRTKEFDFITPNTIHIGDSISISDSLQKLGTGNHGAQEECEGVIYRCERFGRVEFLAKYVRPSKVDGKYLPEISGNDAIYNKTK